MSELNNIPEQEENPEADALFEELETVIGKYLDKDGICIHVVLNILEELLFGYIEAGIDSGIEDCNGEDDNGNDEPYPLVDSWTIQRITSRLCELSSAQIHEIIGTLELVKNKAYQDWKDIPRVTTNTEVKKEIKQLPEPKNKDLPKLDRKDYSLSEFESMIKKLGGNPGDINNN